MESSSSWDKKMVRITDPRQRAVFEKHAPAEKNVAEAATPSEPKAAKGPSKTLVDTFGKEAAWRMWKEGKIHDETDHKILGEDYG